MPDNWSPEPWHISGTVGAFTADLDIDVLGGPVWSMPKQARKMVNLGTGTSTLITRADTSARWQVRLQIVIQPADAVTLRSDLEAIFRLVGPWTLTDAEVNEWDVIVDPTLGSLEYENFGPFRTAAMSFEVV